MAWREEVARVKRAAFRDEEYWGRPVPGFGPMDARLLIVGLAPAAHGANRTGRMFTGDRSGDFLYRALFDVGLASQPTATHIGDGLELYGVRITAPVHCAPPDNKPLPEERDNCRTWLEEEFALLRNLKAVVVLGAFGWNALMPVLGNPRPRPKFGHGVEVEIAGLRVFGCFHVSQQNTFTGRLTQEMLQDVLTRAKDACWGDMMARVGLVVAALLLVLIAARGTSPVVFRPDPPEADVRDTLSPLPNAPQDPGATEGSGIPFLILLSVLLGFVVFGLIGMALAISFTRRTRGERGVEIVEQEPPPIPPTFRHHLSAALNEIRSNRPPKDAVIAAWLQLEAAQPRQPHQTPTEFTRSLNTDATVLRKLYQKARFSREPITKEHADQAERELERIIRELV